MAIDKLGLGFGLAGAAMAAGGYLGGPAAVEKYNEAQVQDAQEQAATAAELDATIQNIPDEVGNISLEDAGVSLDDLLDVHEEYGSGDEDVLITTINGNRGGFFVDFGIVEEVKAESAAAVEEATDEAQSTVESSDEAQRKYGQYGPMGVGALFMVVGYKIHKRRSGKNGEGETNDDAEDFSDLSEKPSVISNATAYLGLTSDRRNVVVDDVDAYDAIDHVEEDHETLSDLFGDGRGEAPVRRAPQRRPGQGQQRSPVVRQVRGEVASRRAPVTGQTGAAEVFPNSAADSLPFYGDRR